MELNGCLPPEMGSIFFRLSESIRFVPSVIYTGLLIQNHKQINRMCSRNVIT